MVSGCATFRNTLSDKRAIYNLSNDLSSLIIAGEVDRVMEFVSDNFTHEEWENKEGLRRFLTQTEQLNLMKGAKLNTSKTKIFINGNVATVYPIGLSAALGEATIRLVYARESATWRVIGFDLDLR